MLRPASEKLLPVGVRLIGAFDHHGMAVRMVHGLKYRGVGWYVELVAEILADRLPNLPLVPVPRAWSRLARYGVDPAGLIASSLSRRLSVPVVKALSRPLHSRRRAGGDHSRPPRPFIMNRPAPSRVIVVDDVVTTGATVGRAVECLGPDRVSLVVAANDATTLSTLAPCDP